MDKTRQLIVKNEMKFPEFIYYLNIIDKIEDNILIMPDVTIESSKALIEGVSKTILRKIDRSYTDKGGKDSASVILKKSLNGLSGYYKDLDVNFSNFACSFINRTCEIRNEKADISHGRSSPKDSNSDIYLSESIAHTTDGIVSYILKVFFNIDWTCLEDVKYEDNEDFNIYLDEELELDGVIYSRALFDQDPAYYKEKYNNYISNKND